jgi:hypothetical protein
MPLPWAYSKPECTTQTALPNPGTVWNISFPSRTLTYIYLRYPVLTM